MNIYLDIDGTLLHEDIERAGKPAEGLDAFLIALRPHDVYWLTTHCMTGDAQYAVRLLEKVLHPALYADIARIKPTTWSVQKTEAIDFSREFIWFENDVMESERDVLRTRALADKQWLIEVDLMADPRRLITITETILSDL